MGKRIISQRRGRGTSTYRAKGHLNKGMAIHPRLTESENSGRIIKLVHCSGHSSPLAQIRFDNGDLVYAIAPVGIREGDIIISNAGEANRGNIVELGKIPEGTAVFNIEAKPGDGGKFVRGSGTFAKVVAHMTGGSVNVVMPSKKLKMFNSKCRAMIGVAAGGGRTEKPLLKAGNMHHKMRSKGRLYPRTSGIAMNAVDHPFGTSRSSKKGKPDIARKHAPPGAKVGKIRPRRTGRKKGSRG